MGIKDAAITNVNEIGLMMAGMTQAENEAE
jgi:hypothetical protein